MTPQSASPVPSAVSSAANSQISSDPRDGDAQVTRAFADMNLPPWVGIPFPCHRHPPKLPDLQWQTAFLACSRVPRSRKRSNNRRLQTPIETCLIAARMVPRLHPLMETRSSRLPNPRPSPRPEPLLVRPPSKGRKERKSPSQTVAKSKRKGLSLANGLKRFPRVPIVTTLKVPDDRRN